MREVNCLLCLANDYVLVDEHLRDPYLAPETPSRTVICQRCGFVYTTPHAEEGDLRAIYGTTYAETRVGAPPHNYLLRKDYDAERKVDWIISKLPDKRGRVLDMGCASGNLLLAFKKRGWEVIGVEPTPHFAEFAREHYQLEVRAGFLDEPLFPPGSFDLIVLAETLEHLPNVRSSLQILWKWLRPGGFLYIDVPNVLRPNKWRLPVKYFRGEHMSYFSPNTLRLMLRSEGFDVFAHTAGFYQYAIGRKVEPIKVDYAAEGDDYKATLRALRWRGVYIVSQTWRKLVKGAVTQVAGQERGLRLIARFARRSGALARR